MNRGFILLISLFCLPVFGAYSQVLSPLNPFNNFFQSLNTTATIEGRVYQDDNGNGTQDAGENGIENVIVIIVDDNTSGFTTSTDANGDWSFNVIPGNTLILINSTTLPAGSVQTEGTEPTTITAVDNATVDAGTDGYAIFGDLNGLVYFDVNGNGTQDAGENGIPNVDVQIDDAFGNSFNVVTDANGEWSTDVLAGNVTSIIDESDPDFPTGAIQTEGTNPTTTTISGGAIFSETDGFFESGELNGRLYLDTNGNGTQDAGENGIANVDIQIDNALGATQIITTDANGDWSIQVPAGTTTSTIDESDPDFPTGTVQTEGTNPTTTVVANDGVFSETDGYFQFGTLTGRVYFDVNGNGSQDTGENGISNVDVQIVDALGDSQIIVTDANGDWSVDVPVGDTTSTIDESDPDFPTGAQQTEGTNPTTTVVTAGDTFNEIDGFFESGELSGRLYLDANGDGVQNTGENGIPNVDVQIDDALGVTQTVVTDTNGDWSFQAPVGNVTTTIDEADPDFPQGTSQTEGTNPTTTTITNAGVFSETDGYFQFGTLTGRVYFDVNGNGTQETGENGIPNVDVQIVDALGDSQIIVTDANGDWTVDVPVGNTTSTIDESDPDFPTGAQQTEGINPTTTVVTAGDTFNEVDGFFESGELSGRLYHDVNGNGTQDTGESGLPNVDVQIDDALGNTQIVVTDANGDWSIQVPVGNVTSTIDQSDPDFPSAALQTEGTNPTTTFITNGDTFSEVDGFFESGELSGRLYFDVNGNGIQDANENGISDVDVQIDNALGNTETAITDANGDWSIQVPIGNTTSTIDESDPDFPTGAVQTEGTNPTTTLVTIGNTFNEVDGFFESGEITGRLYLDDNGNGTQDTGENGIANVDVQLEDAFGNTQIVVTNVNGDWNAQVPVGNFTSTIDVFDPDFPTGAIQTEGTNPTTTLITIASNFSENDGFFVPDPTETGTLTGHIYLDDNGNATQDAGEADLANLDVIITDSQNNTQTVSTDANGDWSIVVPTGNAESDIDESDSDFPAGAIQTEGTDPTTTLVAPNTNTFSENDGYFVPDPNDSGTLTGHLYLDDNGNGTQDGLEADLADVDIFITDSQSNVQVVATDANGDWSVFVPTGNTESDIDESDPDYPTGSIQTEGTDPTITTVIPNVTTFSENDGFFNPDTNDTGTLAGHLYLDDNGNGNQDVGELDLADIDVVITDSQNSVQVVTTDANGDWSVVVPTGNTESNIDETDPDFPVGAIQTEGTDPTTTTVIPNVTTFSENDGYFVPDLNDTGTLTGHLYLDDNGSGNQDVGEPDLPDVDVLITDSQNNTQTVTTDVNGDWSVVVPTGNTESDIDESDPDYPTGSIQTEGTDPTTTLVIPNTITFSDNDGFFNPDPDGTGTLTGHLYFDDNGNGTQDGLEADLANVDVFITDSQNNIQVVTTDANGDWSVVVPTGNTESDIDETDPDYPTGSIQTEGTDPTITTVIPNVTTFSENDGFFNPDPDNTGTLTGHLYLDDNGNGNQDVGEPDLPDVDVLITDSQNNTQTVTTDANGDWSVLVPTGGTESDIDETDPDYPTGSIQTEGTDPTTTTVIPNVTTFSENDGFFIPDPNETGTLTGHIYLDDNGNATQDAGEADLANLDVVITDSQNNTQTVTTDANGDWSVVVPTGNTQSDIDESDPDFPAGAIQTEGTDPTLTTVIPNVTTFSENDGFFIPDSNETGTLTGHLYLDDNGNGTQDGFEADLPDIDILITDSQNNTQTVSTDANGDWSVVVPTGNTESDIDESDPDYPVGAVQTEGTDPTLTTVIPNVITFSENDGYFIDEDQLSTLTGRLYSDENNNGTQDIGEPGIPFVSIEIEDDTGFMQVVDTDVNGDWSAIVNSGDIISLIDVTDPDFPENATQTEGTNPTLTTLNPNEVFNEVDGFFTERDVIVYNAVSPNGDGRNDFLRIDGLEQFETNSIEIFNRNGVRVYETRDYGSNDNLFRGFSDGRITIRKSQKLPSGTYFYILNYTDVDGRTTKRQGYLYIN